MSKITSQFTSLEGAADFLGTGAVEVPVFEREIQDIVVRTSVEANRFPQVKATGHPHRYFDQTAIATGAFTDPRAITPSVTGPTRVERSAFIKALVAQSNISLFDKDVTQQQGQFGFVVAKDIDDILSGIEVARITAFWNGNDTSLSNPTTNQYVGLLNQITNQFTIAPGASIIDGLTAAVADILANQTYAASPTAIYLNPKLANFIAQEAKAAHITLGKTEVVAGVVVRTLATEAGDLPLVSSKFVPTSTGAEFGFDAPPAGYKDYFAAILTEKFIEVPYVSGETDDPNPRLFQLGLTGNLTGQYVGIKFDCIIAKSAAYAHGIVAVQRP